MPSYDEPALASPTAPGPWPASGGPILVSIGPPARKYALGWNRNPDLLGVLVRERLEGIVGHMFIPLNFRGLLEEIEGS